MEGGHFTTDMIKGLDGFDEIKNIDEVLAKMNVMYGENHNISTEEAFKKAKECLLQPKIGGAKKESYITISVNISKKLVKEFKIAYKPAIMQKCLSAFRKHSKATDAVSQLKDAEKYIMDHKDEFIKLYEKEIKEAESKKGTKKSTKKTAKK